MRKFDRFTTGFVVSTALLLSTSAWAGGFSLREQSTTGLGSAFSGSAAGADLSSMYWNPAAVTSQDGLNTLSSYTLIVPDTSIDVTGGVFGRTGTDIGTLGLLGASYGNYQINKDLYVGVSLNSPFGLVTEADNKNWSGRILNRKSEILTINATPTIGYKLMSNLSVAAGVQMQYMKARLQSANTAAPYTADRIIKGEDYGVGYTAGLLYEPAAGTSIGAGFRSSVHHELDGTSRVVGLGSADATADFNSPEIVTLSVRQVLLPNFALMANYEWTNWSRLNELRVVQKATGASSAETYNWKDSWFASLGAELGLSDSLTGRAGVGFEKSPVPDSTRSARVPDSDRVWLSLGASYKWSDSTTFDIGYSHIFFDDSTINKLPYVLGEVSNSADIVSAGWRVKW